MARPSVSRAKGRRVVAWNQGVTPAKKVIANIPFHFNGPEPPREYAEFLEVGTFWVMKGFFLPQSAVSHPNGFDERVLWCVAATATGTPVYPLYSPMYATFQNSNMKPGTLMMYAGITRVTRMVAMGKDYKVSVPFHTFIVAGGKYMVESLSNVVPHALM
jgi:hypothetical protein